MSTREELKRRMDELGGGFDPSRDEIGERWGAETRELYGERGIGARVGFGHEPRCS